MKKYMLICVITTIFLVIPAAFSQSYNIYFDWSGYELIPENTDSGMFTITAIPNAKFSLDPNNAGDIGILVYYFALSTPKGLKATGASITPMYGWSEPLAYPPYPNQPLTHMTSQDEDMSTPLPQRPTPPFQYNREAYHRQEAVPSSGENTFLRSFDGSYPTPTGGGLTFLSVYAQKWDPNTQELFFLSGVEITLDFLPELCPYVRDTMLTADYNQEIAFQKTAVSNPGEVETNQKSIVLVEELPKVFNRVPPGPPQPLSGFIDVPGTNYEVVLIVADELVNIDIENAVLQNWREGNFILALPLSEVLRSFPAADTVESILQCIWAYYLECYNLKFCQVVGSYELVPTARGCPYDIDGTVFNRGNNPYKISLFDNYWALPPQMDQRDQDGDGLKCELLSERGIPWISVGRILVSDSASSYTEIQKAGLFNQEPAVINSVEIVTTDYATDNSVDIHLCDDFVPLYNRTFYPEGDIQNWRAGGSLTPNHTIANSSSVEMGHTYHNIHFTSGFFDFSTFTSRGYGEDSQSAFDMLNLAQMIPASRVTHFLYSFSGSAENECPDIYTYDKSLSQSDMESPKGSNIIFSHSSEALYEIENLTLRQHFKFISGCYPLIPQNLPFSTINRATTYVLMNLPDFNYLDQQFYGDVLGINCTEFSGSLVFRTEPQNIPIGRDIPVRLSINLDDGLWTSPIEGAIVTLVLPSQFCQSLVTDYEGNVTFHVSAIRPGEVFLGVRMRDDSALPSFKKITAGGYKPIELLPEHFKEEVKLSNLPLSFSITQNYPNPFNPTTTIEYALPIASKVTIDVYDILGRRVETLINTEQFAGYHSVICNAGDATSGIYFYKIEAGNFIETKKMLLMK